MWDDASSSAALWFLHCGSQLGTCVRLAPAAVRLVRSPLVLHAAPIHHLLKVCPNDTTCTLITHPFSLCPFPACTHTHTHTAPQNAPAVREDGLPEGNQWRYSEFINAVNSGKVERVRFSKDGTMLQVRGGVGVGGHKRCICEGVGVGVWTQEVHRREGVGVLTRGLEHGARSSPYGAR